MKWISIVKTKMPRLKVKILNEILNLNKA